MNLARANDARRHPHSPQDNNEIRRTILEKMEAKRVRNQQLRQHQHDNEYAQDRPTQQRGPTTPVAPSSVRLEDRTKGSTPKYFRKERGELAGRSDKQSSSYDYKSRSANRNQPQEEAKGGLTRNNSDYLKLHDKLSFLESKISEMRKNLQKKKEEKLKRKKEQEERKKAQEKQQESSQQRPSIDLNSLVTNVPQKKELKAFNNNPYSPRHNIYYVSEIVRAYLDENSLAREHLQTSLQILEYFARFDKPSDEMIAPKKVKLERRKGYEDKKTVVFDLDETLIHCNESLDVGYDVKLPITFPNGEVIEAGINIRPHAREILVNLSKNFEVIVFTASHSCYANVVLDYLDPEGKYIHHRLYREHCYATPEGMHVKDLRVLDRDLDNVVLVDNAAYSYAYQIDNGIPILPFYNGTTDFELKVLEAYIQSMLIKDMREVNKKTFKLHQYDKYFSDLEKLVEDLYLVEH